MANGETGTRKLAAIMFTDIKGFSKKMGEDEVAAMQILRTHDAMMTEVVQKHGGTVIKSIGDSFMVDFSSAVNAVKCAIEAQENFWKYNDGKSEFERIEIRVGIHLGDVVTVGNDVFGDGVNIAARIEAIAEPTRICISEDVYKQIRNKMQVRVYDMGAIELKNIAYPVEVYEILLDSIPGLSEPSESAKNALNKRKAESISKQEEEEAKAVEEARQKAEEEKKKEELDRQRRADEIFQRAEEAFREGNLETADDALKEVFRIMPMHYSAQMLTLQIEEERARREEEERKRRVKEEKRRREEERQKKIQDHLERALSFVEQDQFDQALAAVKEVYSIDPRNAEAKQLEEQIRQAEQAKAELERLQALEAEQRLQEEEQRRQKEAEEALARAKAEAIAERRTALATEIPKSKLKVYLAVGVGAVVVALAAVMLFAPHIFFPSPAGIAVLAFEHSDVRPEENYPGAAISTLITEALARSPELTVISPSTAIRTDARRANIAEVATTLGLKYVVTGSVRNTDLGVVVGAKLTNTENGEVVWETTIDGSLLELPHISHKIAEGLFVALDLPPPTVPEIRLSPSTDAYDFYLKGMFYLEQRNLTAIEHGIAYLQVSLQYDSAFAYALAGLGKGYLARYKYTGEQQSDLVDQAITVARSAVSLNSGIPLAYDVLSEAYRVRERFASAREMANKSLSLQPGVAEPHRHLGYLALVEGNLEAAAQSAALATRIDPDHPDTQLLNGLLHHHRREYAQAVKAYDLAAKLGAEDSLLSMKFKYSALIGADLEDRVYTACEKLLPLTNDTDKVLLHYWIGRAYQFAGKLERSIQEYDAGIALADRILSANPNDFVIHARLALLQSRRGNFEAAQKQMDRAQALMPNDARLQYWKARMYAIQQNKRAALESLAKAIAADYRMSEVLDVDFLSLATEPEFTTTIAKKIQ